MNPVGVVAIGRNEGERLVQCLESVIGRGATVVYVDSASTDGSVAMARSRDVAVVELDMTRPFSAARARNEGFARLMELDPGVRFVQFVDGDCTVDDGWIERGRRELEADPAVAVVCGRRRERHPERSVYNRLADIEWDTPIGEAKACGGDAMIRVEAFAQAGGFDPTIIAGEEPELCLRLRMRGWKVRRIDAEMTVHDMAMTSFGPWWRRMTRGGHAYAEGADRHGTLPERHWVRDVRSIVFWGIALPLASILLALPTRGLGLILLVVYPLQFLRIVGKSRRKGMPTATALPFAASCLIAKFPMALGVVRYHLGRRRGRPVALIEYKAAPWGGHPEPPEVTVP